MNEIITSKTPNRMAISLLLQCICMFQTEGNPIMNPTNKNICLYSSISQHLIECVIANIPSLLKQTSFQDNQALPRKAEKTQPSFLTWWVHSETALLDSTQSHNGDSMTELG